MLNQAMRELLDELNRRPFQVVRGEPARPVRGHRQPMLAVAGNALLLCGMA